jgi:CPA1 family monovalent cation:H+ antiporter
MTFTTVFVVLFVLATAVAVVARRLKVPYTVALVLAGVLVGATRAFEPPHLTKELLFAVFLPGLLFEAAYHLEYRRFVQNRTAILALALPGVAVAIGLTASLLVPAAGVLHVLDGLTLPHALVFAALIAATDPIAVVALFKSVGAPKRLGVLIEGESLLNDGTAVVFFTMALGIAAGAPFSPLGAAVDFVKVVGMGVAIGAGVGLAVSFAIQKIDDPMIEITLTTIAAYGSFGVAEQFHFSGVIATVTAGLIVGNYATHTGMSPSTRVAVETFWEYVAFALNSIVFLLIGFAVDLDNLIASWKVILVAYLAVMIARAVVVAVVSLALRRTKERISWRWSVILAWGGLRGALSMVLVLALPADFPHRSTLVSMTFGVVVLSLLGQGVTTSWLLRRLGIIGERTCQDEYEEHKGRARVAQVALDEVDALVASKSLRPELADDLRALYTRRSEEAEARVHALHLERSELEAGERSSAARHLLAVEKQAILDAAKSGMLGTHAMEQLLRDVDARLVELNDGDDDPANS